LPNTRVDRKNKVTLPGNEETTAKSFPDINSKYIRNPYYEKEKLSFKETLDLINIMTAQLLNDVEFRNK
jgi:hypothetical protein